MASAAGTRQTSSLGRVLVPGPKSRSHARPSTRPAPDPSVLRPSIGVSVTGMRQAVKLLEGATPEVRSYVLNECHLIYECKVCFNMFRSLANFIAHKRSYCQTKLQDVRHVYRREPSEYVDAEPETLTTAFVQPEPVETIIPDEAWDIDNYSPSLELLKEAGLIQEIENRPQVSRLRPQAKAGLDDVVQRLRTRQYLGPERDYFRDQTNHTYGANPPSSMGERYHELERLRQKPCVFVGPDGKIVEPGVPPPNGNMNRLEDLSDFPCPLCHKQFEKLKGLSRHIIRIHKKTQEEATQIQRKSKRMVIARSRFCGLTPEELLKRPSLVASFSSRVVRESRACNYCGRMFYTTQAFLTHKKMCVGGGGGSYRIPASATNAMLSPLHSLYSPVVKLQRLPTTILAQILGTSSDEKFHDPNLSEDEEDNERDDELSSIPSARVGGSGMKALKDETSPEERNKLVENIKVGLDHHIQSQLKPVEGPDEDDDDEVTFAAPIGEPKKSSAMTQVVRGDQSNEVTLVPHNEDLDSGISNENLTDESNDDTDGESSHSSRRKVQDTNNTRKRMRQPESCCSGVPDNWCVKKEPSNRVPGPAGPVRAVVGLPSLHGDSTDNHGVEGGDPHHGKQHLNSHTVLLLDSSKGPGNIV
eukprot:maker-scaffold246_size239296-snap-gene-1.30 protein:Tk01939 transcript:maker-scaffold246_size239296-snap-gene-1.30-mRNA-1 annotation:"hypothetical protein Phum_PHUM332850"